MIGKGPRKSWLSLFNGDIPDVRDLKANEILSRNSIQIRYIFGHYLIKSHQDIYYLIAVMNKCHIYPFFFARAFLSPKVLLPISEISRKIRKWFYLCQFLLLTIFRAYSIKFYSYYNVNWSELDVIVPIRIIIVVIYIESLPYYVSS